MEPLVDDKSVPPLARLYWWSRVGMFYVSAGFYAEAEAALRKADEIGLNFGSHTATMLRHLFWVFLHLVLRDVDEGCGPLSSSVRPCWSRRIATSSCCG